MYNFTFHLMQFVKFYFIFFLIFFFPNKIHKFSSTFWIKLVVVLFLFTLPFCFGGDEC